MFKQDICVSLSILHSSLIIVTFENYIVALIFHLEKYIIIVYCVPNRYQRVGHVLNAKFCVYQFV